MVWTISTQCLGGKECHICPNCEEIEPAKMRMSAVVHAWTCPTQDCTFMFYAAMPIRQDTPVHIPVLDLSTGYRNLEMGVGGSGILTIMGLSI
jgi:hypothetical protein